MSEGLREFANGRYSKLLGTGALRCTKKKIECIGITHGVEMGPWEFRTVRAAAWKE